MKVKVTLLYNNKPDNDVEVEVAERWRRKPSMLDQIDKAVEKQFKDDKDWTRWNLIDIAD